MKNEKENVYGANKLCVCVWLEDTEDDTVQYSTVQERRRNIVRL